MLNAVICAQIYTSRRVASAISLYGRLSNPPKTTDITRHA